MKLFCIYTRLVTDDSRQRDRLLDRGYYVKSIAVVKDRETVQADYAYRPPGYEDSFWFLDRIVELGDVTDDWRDLISLGPSYERIHVLTSLRPSRHQYYEEVNKIPKTPEPPKPKRILNLRNIEC